MEKGSPRSTESRQAQDYPLSAVPPEARKGFVSVLWVLLGFTFFTATMWAGGQVGAAFKLWPDLIGIICLGNLILGLYVASLGWVSQRTGLSSILLARYSFGSWGARWAELLLGLTQVGWYAWGTATVAILFVKLLGLGEVWKYPFMVLFGLAFCWTAWIGYRGLEMLSKVAVPTMTGLIVWSLVIATRDAGGLSGLLTIEPVETMTVGTGVTMLVGTFVSGGTQATNWTRFSRTATQAVVGCMVAFFIGNALMVFAGAYGALVYGQPDIVEVLAIQGLISAGIAMLFLNIWTTQDNTIYNFSIAGSSLLRTPRRRTVTLAGAVLGTLLAIAGMYEWLVPYLVMLGTLIPPLGGIIFADFLVRGRKLPSLESAEALKVSMPGAIAYVAAAVAAHYLPGIPPVNGIVVGGVAYALLYRLFKGSGRS